LTPAALKHKKTQTVNISSPPGVTPMNRSTCHLGYWVASPT